MNESEYAGYDNIVMLVGVLGFDCHCSRGWRIDPLALTWNPKEGGTIGEFKTREQT